jgi:hypothetical protein
MMAGTGVLRPECAAVLVKPTADNWAATEVTEANFAGATTGSPANANFFLGGGAPATGSTVASYLQAAGSGGLAASKARHGLRCNFGGNFSREVVNTAAAAFPYA